MEVREARLADAAEVLAFVRAKAQFDRELGAFTGELGTSEELIRRHLFGPRPFAFALLACGPGSAVGFALYYFRYSSFRGRPSVWLDDLYVQPAGRRQGVGRLIMRRLAEVAAGADCTHIAWVASASNLAGMGFYRRLGATVVQQAGDSVTLQIEPTTLLETIDSAGSFKSGQSVSQSVASPRGEQPK
jgi:GNAT superfamily N-acetyltransferase